MPRRAADAPHANVPAFARDGRLVFWGGIEGQYGELWIWDMPGTGMPARVPSTADPQNSDNPAWAPTGDRLLFDSNRPSSLGGSNIWSMSPDGAVQELLISGANGQTSWQPIFSTDPAP